MAVFQTQIGKEGFSGGVVLATDSVLLPQTASPLGKNSALGLSSAGRPFPQKRKGIACINTTAFTSSPAIIGQYNYFKVSSGSNKHLLAMGNGKLTINNGDGTFTNLGTTPLTNAGSYFPDFETASDLCFIVDGGVQVKTDGSTVTNFGITRPTVGSMSAAGGAAGSHNGTYELRVTFYNSATGHESSASDTASATVTVANKKLDWSNIPTSSDTQVDTRYLYVRNTATMTQFYRAGTISDNSSTTKTTDIADSALTIAAPTTDSRNRPPTTARFLAYHEGRMFVATTSAIYWSPIGEPEAFPLANTDDVNGSDGQEITGLHSDHGVLMIFKTDRLYVLQGDDPTLWTITLQDADRGCVAHRTIQSANGFTWFWSRHGAVRWSGAGPVDTIGEQTYGGTQDTIDASEIIRASAAYDETNNRILMSVPESGLSRASLILPWNTDLGVLESSRWDPMDCASLGSARDSNGDLFTYLGNYAGQIFKVWSSDNDGIATANTTTTGTFVAGSTSISSITDSGATFDTTGAGLKERKVTIIDSNGVEVTSDYRPYISSNTGTSLTLNQSVTTVSGSTYTYIVGGPNFEWRTPWEDDSNPFVKKRYEYLFLIGKGTGFGSSATVLVDFDYDEVNQGGKQQSLTFPILTSIWDSSIWDTNVWDSVGNKEVRFRVARAGKVWRTRVINRYANRPFGFLIVGMQGLTQSTKS